MVVMAMTALLMALLLPALSTAKEKSRRAVCKSNLRQLVMVMGIDAFQNDDLLPSCADNKGYYHSIVLSDVVFSNLVDDAGGNSNIFYCPNIVFGAGPVQQTNDSGYVIGYSYLEESIANSIKGPDYTVEPVKWPSTSTNELLADANYWTSVQTGTGCFPAQMKVAPHGAMGAAMAMGTSFTVGLPGGSSASIGAVGGNIAFVDGSVVWRNLSKMQTNPASSDNYAYGNW